MARQPQHDWYLRDWMTSLEIRFPHAWLQKHLDWSDGKASNVLSGKKRYDKDIVNAVSAALQIEPFELLMSPALANAIRAMRQQAPKLAADADAAAAAQATENRRVNLRG